MRYRANKKVSCRQDQHQKQYVPLPFGGGHNDFRTLIFLYIYPHFVLRTIAAHHLLPPLPTPLPQGEFY